MKEKFQELLKYNEDNKKIKVAVAMSGGVDSSVVAYLLKAQGYDIIGVTMRTYHFEDSDAKKVADLLEIPHYVYDAREEFKKEVIDKFTQEYLKGKTPNPCMFCNRDIKFGKLLEFAKSKGAQFMATGHYAQNINGEISIGDDDKKDQVYFLSQIKRENLKDILFPIGKLEKTEVRELGKELGVPVYAKKDSQEICFVEDGKLKEFLIEHTEGEAQKKGEIVDSNGKRLGYHEGVSFYTIGQRKGLGISSTTPLYVIKLDSKKNQVIVGEDSLLWKDKIAASKINLLLVNNIKDLESLELYAKTRSRDSLHKCSVKVIHEDKILVEIVGGKVRAVTPGQGLVLYNMDKKVVASGYIE